MEGRKLGYEFYPRYQTGTTTRAKIQAAEDQILVDAVDQQAKRMTKYNYTRYGGRRTATDPNAKKTYARSSSIETKAHLLIEGCYVGTPADYDGVSNNLDEWCNLVALGIQDYAKYRYPEKFGAAPAQEANA